MLNMRKKSVGKWLLLSAVSLAVVLLVLDGKLEKFEFHDIDHKYPNVASPNWDNRPFGTPINCVVLHATTQETLDETLVVFLNSHNKVSAHYIVDKNGHVVQTVPVEQRAWHAGFSKFDGLNNVNDFSVGIEMVNLNDGHDKFTNAQYQATADIIRTLRSRCDIPDSRIVSHAQVAIPAGRKSDPLGFDFQKLYRILKG